MRRTGCCSRIADNQRAAIDRRVAGVVKGSMVSRATAVEADSSTGGVSGCGRFDRRIAGAGATARAGVWIVVAEDELGIALLRRVRGREQVRPRVNRNVTTVAGDSGAKEIYTGSAGGAKNLREGEVVFGTVGTEASAADRRTVLVNEGVAPPAPNDMLGLLVVPNVTVLAAPGTAVFGFQFATAL